MSMGMIFHFDATEARRAGMRSAACEMADVLKSPVEEKPESECVVPTAPVEVPSKKELEASLINFVVEQTGYPEDMVEMDVDLEGDLGIDSIKKAQLLGELNETLHFVDLNVLTNTSMVLDDFPTLASIRDFILERIGSAPVSQSVSLPAAVPVESVKTFVVSTLQKKELEASLINFVVEQTGYPEDMVEMDVDLEGDLGIDSIKKAQLLGELNETLHFVDLNVLTNTSMVLDDFPTLASIRDFILERVG